MVCGKHRRGSLFSLGKLFSASAPKLPCNALPVLTDNSVRSENTGVPTIREIMVATTMSPLFVALFALVASSFRSRAALQAESLALRHQLAVFQKNAPRRLRLHRCDRLLWVVCCTDAGPAGGDVSR
jgi:hypothetical protein